MTFDFFSFVLGIVFAFVWCAAVIAGWLLFTTRQATRKREIPDG